MCDLVTAHTGHIQPCHTFQNLNYLLRPRFALSIPFPNF